MKNVDVYYGLFTPVVISIIKNMFGSFELADYLRLQQYANGLFFILCMLAYGKAAKWQTHGLLMLALLILPWINGLPEWIAAPNQSAVRYFGFGLTLFYFAYAQGLKPNSRAILSGFLAALSLLLNTETGIILSVALLGFIFFSNDFRRWPNLLLKFLCFLFSFFGTMIVFLFNCSSTTYRSSSVG